MSDPYTNISELNEDVQLKLSNSLEIRAADPHMKQIINTYLSEVKWVDGMRVLDVGCGTGAITRELAKQRDRIEVIGIDPSPIFVEKAKSLTQNENITYLVGDGKSLPFPGESFDAVVFHTVLCHVSSPELFLREAYRVLKKGGQLVIFDGDYSLRSVAIGEHDPLQACIEIMKKYNCYDIWLVRRLPALISSMGFDNLVVQSYGYLATKPDYMVNFLERGIERLVEFGQISEETAKALKAEASQRVEDGRFFGFIPFLSFIARKK
ncbi:methyltransferase domain-containing protein [Ammoniphilus resinae]|uniref:Ubiquinone/menaquinone biosynthesis C-methylase UbiE n=1 Tax=Ammoniphilus resinae TaxID=861532 RepID=A0ABS4GLV3_9BACL|nr:methyltransferase domain-containing protein [Ammoniphilus resinae]MBP1931245.1 ubiquinone/menaquinone biosynthesis C-methylase UbiE [Ammoniphilus resinae]